MQAFELSILDWLQLHLRCGFLDAVMPAVSRICDHGEVWILMAAILLLTKRYRRAGASAACALLLDLMVCNLFLKPLVGRLRPFAVNATVTLLVPPPLDASFPSGHTAASFAAAAALWTSGSRRMGAAALALACVIAFSRLYLYVHWPSDVLAGAILGTVLGWAGTALIGALARARRSGGKKRT